MDSCFEIAAFLCNSDDWCFALFMVCRKTSVRQMSRTEQAAADMDLDKIYGRAEISFAGLIDFNGEI